MFTGIVEAMGRIAAVEAEGSNVHFWVESSISGTLRADQSVAHDGVCLTVVETRPGAHRVTAVRETLDKTALGAWAPGQAVNLERSLRLGDRLDGHFVQGHVDAVAACISKTDEGGSWRFTFRFPPEHAALVIEKGSVCINGISLTCFGVDADQFSVAIIPYTYAHTGFGTLRPGDAVNIEFDVLGKYFLRARSLGQKL